MESINTFYRRFKIDDFGGMGRDGETFSSAVQVLKNEVGKFIISVKEINKLGGIEGKPISMDLWKHLYQIQRSRREIKLFTNKIGTELIFPDDIAKIIEFYGFVQVLGTYFDSLTKKYIGITIGKDNQEDIDNFINELTNYTNNTKDEIIYMI